MNKTTSPYDTAIVDDGPGTKARAQCDCMWTGPWRPEPIIAAGDKIAHEKTHGQVYA